MRPSYVFGITSHEVNGCLLSFPVLELTGCLLACVQDEEEMQRLTERMKALLGPFVLRRLKSEVASQLASKDQRVELVDMTPVQASTYSDAVQQLRSEASAAGLQAGPTSGRLCSTCFDNDAMHVGSCCP